MQDNLLPKTWGIFPNPFSFGYKGNDFTCLFFFSSEENVTKVDEESKVCLLGLVSMQYYFAHMLLFEIGSGGAQWSVISSWTHEDFPIHSKVQQLLIGSCFRHILMPCSTEHIKFTLDAWWSPDIIFWRSSIKTAWRIYFFWRPRTKKVRNYSCHRHPKLAGNYYLVILLGQEIMTTIKIRMMMIMIMPGIYPPFLPPFIYQVCQVLKLQRMPFGWWMNTVVPFTRISLTKLPATVGVKRVSEWWELMGAYQ